ncbi:hypothetical protein LP421_33750 (plasmid) [Rhizobium sp. RCAM05350]|uniref:hypothetical protein n=1 Tax=Rhizobium sp. RCAM05350 TaxID=2895568 RepID=UPI0020766F06|nr:hypothetical protein [Rhizobium sp. RCAM05350]URK89387.1 hypothetical protein LP421_33750 [Rhizobium sp. RCAM05350]
MTRYAEKLARIKGGQYRPSDFIIADAKDSDMAGGITTTGVKRRPGGGREVPYTRSEFLENIRQVIAQDVVDIVLTSASNMEALTKDGAFRNGTVARAIRANDSTDVWGAIRGSDYTRSPSRPFRSASLDRAVRPVDLSGENKVDLGLYSITFNNDLDRDYQSLEAFSEFRREAASCGFKYFLEVFNPNVDARISPELIPAYVTDSIIRTLAGIVEADRPQFLKVVYNGPEALEELCAFDPGVVVGVLGGSSGTTRDCFELLSQAERFGGRVALFGRKINLAESPLDLISLMRSVTNGEISPKNAVRAYHGSLERLGLNPLRSLEDDLVVTSAPLVAAASE